MAAERVAGDGWVDNNPTLLNDADSLRDKPFLRIIGVNFEKLAHDGAETRPYLLQLYAQAVRRLHK